MNLVLFAQRDPNPADALSGLMCMGTCFFILVLPIILLGLNLACLFWVARDAKSRGMDGAMWIFLILFTGVVGLAIYLFSRPQGMLIECEECGNNRMEVSAKCPHCGNR